MTSTVGEQLDHVAVLHRGHDDAIDRVAPMILDAVDQGWAVLACVPTAYGARLAEVLGPAGGRVELVDSTEHYARPVVAMDALARWVDARVADGAARVLSLGAADSMAGEPDDWVRYEAAVNEVFAHRPLQAVCLYDVDHHPPAFLDGVRCAHPHLVEDGRRGESDRWVDAATACAGLHRPRITPGRAADVVVEALEDLRSVRRLVRSELGAERDPDQVATLELAVSELVTNAWLHGGSPTRLSIWREPDGAVVEVRDGGGGITDPFAGLRPPSLPDRGAGLWVANQICDRFAIGTGPGGGAAVAVVVGTTAP